MPQVDHHLVFSGFYWVFAEGIEKVAAGEKMPHPPQRADKTHIAGMALPFEILPIVDGADNLITASWASHQTKFCHHSLRLEEKTQH